MVTKIENPVWQTFKDLEHMYANKAILVERNFSDNTDKTEKVLYYSDDELELNKLLKTLPRKSINGYAAYAVFFIDTSTTVGGLYFD